jgi:hypothetical protein
MSYPSLPVRLAADLVVLAVLAWFELGRLRQLLADSVAPQR